MKIQVVQRASDGRFWERGCDSPDRWITDPLHATRVGGYVYLRDAIDGLMYRERALAEHFKAAGYEIVEFVVSASPTGLTTNDLYRDGIAMSEWEAGRKK